MISFPRCYHVSIGREESTEYGEDENNSFLGVLRIIILT